MNVVQSIQRKANVVFLALCFVVLATTAIAFGGIQNLRNTSQRFVDQGIPTVRSVQQMLLALDKATIAIDQITVGNELYSMDDIRNAEAAFNHAAMTYITFDAALLHGSTTDSFRQYDGGIPFTLWHQRGLHEMYTIPPAQHDVNSVLRATEPTLQQLLKTGQRFFRLKRKEHRLLAQQQDVIALQEELNALLTTIHILSDRMWSSMERVISINDQNIRSHVSALQQTQVILLVVMILALPLILGIVLIGIGGTSALLIAPIQSLARTAQKIADGDLSERSPIRSKDEIGLLARTFNDMAHKLQVSHTELEERVQEQTQKLFQKVEEAEQQKTAMLNILEDLEEAKKTIEAEVQNARKFQQAVNASTNAIAITYPSLEYVYVNPAWETITGYQATEVMGKTPNILCADEESLSVFEEMLFTAKRGQRYASEALMFQSKEGVPYNVALTMYPIQGSASADPDFYVLIHEDITSRKKTEAAKSEFVSLASHQLRTPLTSIRWILEMIANEKAGSISTMQQELVGDARKCARLMAQTIGTMLMLSRVESDKVHIDYETVRVLHILEEIEDDQRTAIAAKHQTLSLDCASDLTVRTDIKIMHEILSNLVSNASKYTPEKGCITLLASQEGDSIHISVRDSGIGIPAEQHEQIFTKFFRADNVLKSDTEGTGLGLYLVYCLVTLLQGNITFSSEEGVGTTFTLSFPIMHSPPSS